MKKTGLFFGSFNPIHIGHLVIAEYMVENTDLEEIWFVVSPQNPLKEKKSLLADNHRWYMVNLAIENDARFKAIDIEFHMPRPSYTIDTLTRLNEKYPNNVFVLVTGSDIFKNFHKWKNHDTLINQFPFYVYNRPNFRLGSYENHPQVKLFDAPQMEISSSFIRNSIKEEKEIQYMLPPQIDKYIKEMNFYKK
ncbi:MAG: nicotinic acid mononucleotide adenylyltransferase [Bacteroidetes bacterium HGW-Bacteroidetes-17]|jgi:nicotinate-nucleotide adenylyltransferase|nr:MAG: nicotinic acid mononucleotide adenylyltransferase [Bacteroidetes bacterium HGW-Bacteroidetes-17]